jgi:MYXO-CTERM domain-containing protein
MRRPFLISIAAMLAVAALLPPVTRADGDPASDVLLGQNVFYPYSPAVTPSIQKALDATTLEAKRSGFPIKVALIASPVDLGVIPDLFGKPQKYAEFLVQEISFNTKQPLLVVMPAGLGSAGLPAPSASALPGIPRPAGNQTNDLARTALAAIPKLAAAAGHHVKAGGGQSASAGGGGASVAIIAGLMIVALAGVAAAFATRRRRAAAQPSEGS